VFAAEITFFGIRTWNDCRHRRSYGIMARNEPYEHRLSLPFSPSKHKEVTAMKNCVFMIITLALIASMLACGGGGGGNVYAQAVSVTNNASWVGSFSLRQSGFFVSPFISPSNSTTISGQLSADGNGNFTGTLDFNDPASVFPSQSASGTYSVGSTAPGRTKVAITTPLGTRNYIAYAVSDQRVQMIEVDNNLTSGGARTFASSRVISSKKHSFAAETNLSAAEPFFCRQEFVRPKRCLYTFGGRVIFWLSRACLG
jgi:hypothetical protein